MDGLHVIRGEDLPDGFVTNTGHGYKGKHIAQILLRPHSTRRLPAPDVDYWPKARDVLHVGLGVFGFLMLRFFRSVSAEPLTPPFAVSGTPPPLTALFPSTRLNSDDGTFDLDLQTQHSTFGVRLFGRRDSRSISRSRF